MLFWALVYVQGMINHLYKAHAACVANETAPEAFVDQAWVLWYGNAKGPIALGDKRCIQFGTCTDSDTDTFPSDHEGDSAVNTAILAAFLATQTAAKSADCAAMLTQIEDTIVPQAFVPVMQGLFREAWYDNDLALHIALYPCARGAHTCSLEPLRYQ